jgi:hypothetical protein
VALPFPIRVSCTVPRCFSCWRLRAGAGPQSPRLVRGKPTVPGVRLGVSANLYKACCRKAAVETFEFECELVVRQNFSRGPKRGGSGGVGVNTMIDSVQQEDPIIRGRARCAWSAHIQRTAGRKSIRTMPLDSNGGAALRVAPVKGPGPKLRNAHHGQDL